MGNRKDFNSYVLTISHHNIHSLSSKLLELSFLLNSDLINFIHFMLYRTLTNGRKNESFKYCSF